MATEGALTGRFTINANGDQIVFSQGNLQYVGTWQFAEKQWDYFGINQSDDHRDLFGWGTGDAPNKVSENGNDYSTFTDWGTNAITNGGNTANTWRTMTKDEWVYLFYTRANAATLFGLGSVNGVNGTILLPDNMVLPNGASFTASTTQGLADQGGYFNNENGNNFSHNTYTTEQWSVMESAGAVFLPAAGGCVGTDVNSVGSAGSYWSATSVSDQRAYCMTFSSDGLSLQYGLHRYYGPSVRLVRDICLIASGTCGDNLTWELSCDSVLTISGTGEMGEASWRSDYKEQIKEVVIEDGITSITSSAFNGCTSLRTISIGSGISSIGSYAFSWSEKLTYINVSSENQNYCSVEGVLFDKEQTKLINFPEGKQGINYTIPNSVTSIEEDAFFNSQYLDSITIPYSVINIATDAFLKSSVTKVNIVDLRVWCTKNYEGWTASQYNTLYDLYLNGEFVSNIVIPDDVNSLGKFAFSQCRSILSVSIPENVTTIGYGVFFFSKDISTIYNYATTPQTITSASFSQANKSTCVLYVPGGSIELYKSADGWKEFENILPIPSTEVYEEDVNINYLNKTGGVIDSEQVTLTLPAAPEIEGFTFLKWKVVESDLTDGINIQAVYAANAPTDAPTVFTNPANPVQKLIRQGNVYILTGDRTYTLTGQEVK